MNKLEFLKWNLDAFSGLTLVRKRILQYSGNTKKLWEGDPQNHNHLTEKEKLNRVRPTYSFRDWESGFQKYPKTGKIRWSEIQKWETVRENRRLSKLESFVIVLLEPSWGRKGEVGRWCAQTLKGQELKMKVRTMRKQHPPERHSGSFSPRGL